MSITDHDTVAGLGEASALARSAGIVFVNGVEVTAVHDGRDVHMLGYFFDASSETLAAFLDRQRSDRLRRLAAMADRLAELGKPIDRARVLARKPGGASLGRPVIARALVRAGHVVDMRQAFDEYLGHGRPVFVPRVGPTPAEAIGTLASAGGIVSLAHPGLLKRDDLIPGLAEAGLAALEAYHSEHDPDTTRRYLESR